jgi:hypothetical protein
MTDVDAVVDARLYYTLLARSCEQAHGDHTEAAFITHVFAAFRALAPGNGDNPMFARKLVPLNPRLTYWLPDDDPGQSLRDMFRGNTADSRHSGSCKAWAEAFICMAAMHGINALRNVLVTPNRALANTATSFLVNTFTFTPAPAPSGTAYTHDWTAGPAAPGEATWGPGVVGQNNQTPPPCFENHFIVIDQNGVYYDPSYGSGPHATWQAWKTAAIAGLRDRRVSPDSGYKATLAIPKVVALEDAVTSAPLN